MQEILRPEYLCVSYTGERDSLMDVQKQVKALKQTLHKEEVSVQHQNMTCVKITEQTDLYKEKRRLQNSRAGTVCGSDR